MQSDFEDPKMQAHLAPASIRPPFHFADGGYARSFDPPLNAQSQINTMSAAGKFSGMGNQLNEPRPSLANQPVSSMPSVVPNSPQSNPNAYLMGNPGASAQQQQPLIPDQNQINQTQIPTYTPPTQDGNAPLQQMGQQPQEDTGSPLAAYAKGGSVGVEGLISKIKAEFEKRGLDFDKVMAARLAHRGKSQ